MMFTSAVLIAFIQIALRWASGEVCRGLSIEVPCQCDGYGRCIKGTVEVDPWLQFALKTQRELQIDIPIDKTQTFAAHNAFNARVYGIAYGANDTCNWPPPYDNVCFGWGNHEFSIFDILNMGVRLLEIDIWWCEGAMRAAHIGTSFAFGCGDFNILFSDVIAEIGQWTDGPGNEDEYIRIYINEGYDQGHDAEVNGPLERYLGHDRILSPADFRDTYRGVWPTLRRMREDGKRVVVVGDHALHQAKYIHVDECDYSTADRFTNYPLCGGKSDTNCIRFGGDATHYVLNIVWDGPTQSGAILDLTEMVKCRIDYPATDMVSPQLMETGVYTWAKGEPSLELGEDTCVMLNHEDFRWYTSPDCSQSLSYACQSSSDPNEWTISESTWSYDVTRNACPIGYKFSVTHNGYRQQKLKEAMNGASVWLNFSPWLTGHFPTTAISYNTASSADGYRTTRRSIVAPVVVILIVLFARFD